MNRGFQSHHAFCGTALGVVLVSLLQLVGTAGAVAQTTGEVRGLVQESETGRPIEGAVVTVVGSTIQVRTAADGRFHLVELPPGEVVLRFNYDGRVTVVEKVRVGPGTVTGAVFELPVHSAILEELMILGVNDGPADSRQVIDTDAVVGRSSESVGDVVNEAGGVQLIRVTGQVGAPYHLRIRGVNSLTFSATPLIFIDGVRIAGSTDFGSSVLDLINPQDVARIEVLRGPATTAPYGSGAQNGVILITTKRGGVQRPN